MQKSRKYGSITLIVLVLVVGVAMARFGRIYWHGREARQIHREMDAVFSTQVKPLLPEAIHTLAVNQNDWHYCTIIGLPSIRENNPQALAAHVAYYQWGYKYCKNWWTWGESKCSHLENLGHDVPYQDILDKDLDLCLLAAKTKNEYKQYTLSDAQEKILMRATYDRLHVVFPEYNAARGKVALLLCTELKAKQQKIQLNKAFYQEKQAAIAQQAKVRQQLFALLRKGQNQFGEDVAPVIGSFFISESTMMAHVSDVNNKFCQTYTTGFDKKIQQQLERSRASA